MGVIQLWIAKDKATGEQVGTAGSFGAAYDQAYGTYAERKEMRKEQIEERYGKYEIKCIYDSDEFFADGEMTSAMEKAIEELYEMESDQDLDMMVSTVAAESLSYYTRDIYLALAETPGLGYLETDIELKEGTSLETVIRMILAYKLEEALWGYLTALKIARVSDDSL